MGLWPVICLYKQTLRKTQWLETPATLASPGFPRAGTQEGLSEGLPLQGSSPGVRPRAQAPGRGESPTRPGSRGGKSEKITPFLMGLWESSRRARGKVHSCWLRRACGWKHLDVVPRACQVTPAAAAARYHGSPWKPAPAPLPLAGQVASCLWPTGTGSQETKTCWFTQGARGVASHWAEGCVGCLPRPGEKQGPPCGQVSSPEARPHPQSGSHSTGRSWQRLTA